jgi:type III restriction enzyme
VAETKDAGDAVDPAHGLLRPLEQYKIDCARKHFRNFEEVHYRVVAKLAELVSSSI